MGDILSFPALRQPSASLDDLPPPGDVLIEMTRYRRCRNGILVPIILNEWTLREVAAAALWANKAPDRFIADMVKAAFPHEPGEPA